MLCGYPPFETREDQKEGKFKFYADRETGDPDFALARLNPETKQRDFELTDGLSLEDLRSKVFRYMGHQRLIFQMRGWTDKLTKRTPRFGLTFIIKCVEYTPPIKREPKQTKADISFIDSDEEEELQNAEDDY